MIQRTVSRLLTAVNFKSYLCRMLATLAGRKPEEKDYGLNSGERQTATRLEGVRVDHRARYQFVIDYLQMTSSRCRIGLDCFSGTGYGSEMLSAALDTLMISIDGSEDGIRLAEENFSSYKTFHVLKQFPFRLPSQSFDFAVSLESIEHVERDVEFLQTLANTVVDGGCLFVSAPNEEVNPFDSKAYKFHCRHYTKDDLAALSQECGLQIEAIYSQDGYRWVQGEKEYYTELDDVRPQQGTHGQWLIAVLRKSLQ